MTRSPIQNHIVLITPDRGGKIPGHQRVMVGIFQQRFVTAAAEPVRNVLGRAFGPWKPTFQEREGKKVALIFPRISGRG